MAQIFDLDKVLDPWVALQDDDELVRAVFEKLMWVSDNLSEVSGWPALPGRHPWLRQIEVDEGVLISLVLLGPPVPGARLFAIETLE